MSELQNMEEFMQKYRERPKRAIFDIENDMSQWTTLTWERLRLDICQEISVFKTDEIKMDKIENIRKSLAKFLKMDEKDIIKDNKYDWMKLVRLFMYVDKLWYPIQEYIEWKHKHIKAVDEFKIDVSREDGRKLGFFNMLKKPSFENLPIGTLRDSYAIDEKFQLSKTVFGDKITYLKQQIEKKVGEDYIKKAKESVDKFWEIYGSFEEWQFRRWAVISCVEINWSEKQFFVIKDFLESSQEKFLRIIDSLNDKLKSEVIGNNNLYQYTYERILVCEIYFEVCAEKNMFLNAFQLLMNQSFYINDERVKKLYDLADERVIVNSYKYLKNEIEMETNVRDWFKRDTQWEKVYLALAGDIRKQIEKKREVLIKALDYVVNFDDMNRNALKNNGIPLLTVVAAIECGVWINSNKSSNLAKPELRRDYSAPAWEKRKRSLKNFGDSNDDISMNQYIVKLINVYGMRLVHTDRLFCLYYEDVKTSNEFCKIIVEYKSLDSLLVDVTDLNGFGYRRLEKMLELRI